MTAEYLPVFSCPHSGCGYFNSRFHVCGLIPEHRDILCPFDGDPGDRLDSGLEGGDADGQQLHQDDLP